MTEEPLFGSCSRSQTAPDMSRLEAGGATSPDSLLSETAGEEVHDKTPDSAISDRILPVESAWTERINCQDPGGDEAWNMLLEQEKETLQHRVVDLEKKVEVQADEIVCLKATVAECLRRLAELETTMPQIEVRKISGGSSHADSAVDTTDNGLTRIPTRSRLRSPQGGKRPSMRSKYQRGNSSEIDGNEEHVIPVINLRKGHSVSSGGGSVSRAGNAASRRRPTGSLGRLQKKWRSTSDFDTPPLTLYKRITTGSSLSFRSPSSTPSTSQYNLDKYTKSFAPPEPEYNYEDGVMKLSLRGRLVGLYCPSEEMYQYHPAISPIPPPAQKLRLDWVHGYRGKDSRCNLYSLPTGEMVYYIATVAVLYNMMENSQRHYTGHSEEIKCMAVHPNKMVVATGQGSPYYKRESDPHIQVWNAVNLQTLQVIGRGEFTRTIACMAFSKANSGVWLGCVDESPDHVLTMWDWQIKHKLLETKSSNETVVAMEFHPLDLSTLITCGKGHVNFWQIELDKSSLNRKTGIFDARDKPKYFTCLAFNNNGDLLTGDSNGNIFVWGRGYHAVTKVIWSAHTGPVFSMCVLKDGELVTGGGKDGRIVVYDTLYRKLNEEATIDIQLGAVRVITEGFGSQLLVGTTNNCILAGNLEIGFRPVVLGHSDEIFCLSFREGSTQFLTGGHDRLLILWDVLSHSPVKTFNIGDQVQSGVFSPDDEKIIVGTRTGKWLILDSRTREVESMCQETGEPILHVSFSPKGQFLGLVSASTIYIYQVLDQMRAFERIVRYSVDSGSLISMDWSSPDMDATFIQVNTTEKDVFIWKLNPVQSQDSASERREYIAVKVTDPGTIRDLVWNTTHCLLQWNTMGVWQGGQDDLREGKRCDDLLAVGDENGNIRLYKYPANQTKSQFNMAASHSGPVTGLTFTNQANKLLSMGGRDCSIMHWTLE